ncbi:unnamed protein product [Withania somnifera]
MVFEMEKRKKKYRQLSPERAKVWTEKSPKYQQQQPQQNDGKVLVVYYLCRNQRLEHPHFLEVPLSSLDGLYLRVHLECCCKSQTLVISFIYMSFCNLENVTKRFNVLRGNAMASSYSWSCKRSYKNRFVWHDLCEDDLILPAHGTEYVLKGSELCEGSNSGLSSPAKNDRFSNRKVLPEPPSPRSHDDSSPYSSMNERYAKNSCGGEPSLCTENSASLFKVSSSIRESTTNSTDGVADAFAHTQEDPSSFNTPRDICRRGVSTDRSSEVENNEIIQVQVSRMNESTEKLVGSDPHPPPSTSTSSGDVSKLRSFRTLDREECRVPSTKLKPHNMLMQLISCGTISVKDHSFGLIHTYKPRLSLGKFDCMTRNKRLMSLRFEDEEYFCASWTESAICKEGVPALKQSSFFTAERINKQPGDPVKIKDEPSSRCSKCTQHSINASLNNVPKNEILRSHLSEESRISAEGVDIMYFQLNLFRNLSILTCFDAIEVLFLGTNI